MSTLQKYVERLKRMEIPVEIVIRDTVTWKETASQETQAVKRMMKAVNARVAGMDNPLKENAPTEFSTTFDLLDVL